ncbi:hypothetical protein FRB99_008518 [Tulasnella sp. 403]|nr:hypothetical protein FRB99_008518 [Tulasnella sp. 403]
MHDGTATLVRAPIPRFSAPAKTAFSHRSFLPLSIVDIFEMLRRALIVASRRRPLAPSSTTRFSRHYSEQVQKPPPITETYITKKGTALEVRKEGIPPVHELEVEWSAFLPVLGQPMISTYKALVSVGYDAPWEVFIKHADLYGDKLRICLRDLDTPQAELLRRRIYLYERVYEAEYLEACWEAYQRKKKSADPSTEPDSSPSAPFSGGSWKDWKAWRITRAVDEAETPEVVSTTRSPYDRRWGVMSLKRPGPDDYWRWHEAVRVDESMISINVHKAVRNPDPPSKAVAYSRLYFNIRHWPIGEPRTYCLVYDKDMQAARFLDKQWNDVAPPQHLEDLVQAVWARGFLYLASLEGLVDMERFAKYRKQRLMQIQYTTFDLATLSEFDGHYRSYALTGNRSAIRFRIHLKPPEIAAPASPTAANTEPDGSTIERKQENDHSQDSAAQEPAQNAGEVVLDHSLFEDTDFHRGHKSYLAKNVTTCKEWAQEVSFVPHPEHTGNQLLKAKDGKPPGAPAYPVLPRNENNIVRVTPYITTFGAYRNPDGTSKWLIDLSTPNTSTSPPTAPPSELEQATPPEHAILVRSDSPETLRFWSPDIKQDILSSVTRRRHDLRASTCIAGMTGEHVRDKYPILMKWARMKGHWKGISQASEAEP